MAVTGLKAVFQWVMRTMMKSKGETGIVQTLPNKDLVELNTQITAQRLMQNGIDPTQLKNADQVENAIIAIESKPKTGGVTSAKSAKVFDMEGKEIDPKKGIMGGKQVDDDLPPPGSRGGKDDIAAPAQSSEETIKNMIEAENKKNISKMRNRKMVKDAIDNASPGFVSGDRKYNAQLVAEDLAERKFGKEFYDLDQRQQMDLYDEALEGLSKQTRGMPDPDDFAQGGRAGFSKGKLVDLARRKFLKAAAGVGAGIGALKTGLLGIGKEAAPMVEAAKETVTKAPDYFFALVDKIKRFGRSVDDAVADRRLEQTYKYKNYELRENAFGEPGETIITKTDDMGEFGYKEESMRFKKGGQTEDGFVPDEYEEVTVRPDAEGKLKDVEDGIEDVSEIIEEATKSAPPIKKASGGIARMLGE
jgi:hypothetical protein